MLYIINILPQFMICLLYAFDILVILNFLRAVNLKKKRKKKKGILI